MAEIVHGNDGNKGGQEIGRHRLGVYARGVQVDGNEADGDMQDLAGDLVTVDLMIFVGQRMVGKMIGGMVRHTTDRQ